jgi:hypothetical protein
MDSDSDKSENLIWQAKAYDTHDQDKYVDIDDIGCDEIEGYDEGDYFILSDDSDNEYQEVSSEMSDTDGESSVSGDDVKYVAVIRKKLPIVQAQNLKKEEWDLEYFKF